MFKELIFKLAISLFLDIFSIKPNFFIKNIALQLNFLIMYFFI